MRRLLPLIALAVLAAPAGALAATSDPALRSLQRSLSGSMRQAGSSSGALVVDLTARRTLFRARHTTGRLPASVEKVWTTSSVLARFGPRRTFSTRVFGVGSRDSHGIWHGDLYLRGSGDPTFGSRAFGRRAYGGGTSVEDLARALHDSAKIRAVTGLVVGDETLFDSRRGTSYTGYRTSVDIGGPLSALAFDRGLARSDGSSFQSDPPAFAAAQLVRALRSLHVSVPSGHVATGATPRSARRRAPLALVRSASIARIIRLTNQPSDNYFAEMLLKDLGAYYSSAGSTTAGAHVAEGSAHNLGLHPTIFDGSGLLRSDRSSPTQMVGVLQRFARNRSFTDSLAVAGRSGTLARRLRGTTAAGRCRGKTGTLSNVSNLVGYCRDRGNHLLVFALLMNRIDPSRAHVLQDRMALALARYRPARTRAPVRRDPPPPTGGAAPPRR